MERCKRGWFFGVLLIVCFTSLFANDFGNALQFDGKDDFVFVGNDTMLQVKHFTLAAWVHPYFYSELLVNEQRMEVLEKAGEYWMNISTTDKGNRDTIGKIRVGGKFGEDAKWYYLDSNCIVPLNVWTHIACTYDGDSLRLFVNGERETAREIPEDFTVRAEYDNMLALGCKCKTHPDSLVEAQFHGMLDEISIWDSPLDQFEIREIMYASLTPAHPKWNKLAAYYKFEEDAFRQSIFSIVDSKNAVNGRNIGAVWLPSTLTEVRDREEAIAANYELRQNYPNPFNPHTTIEFHLPQAGQVELTVFDLTGRHVKTLINEQLNAGGHTIAWNASGLPSGVYYYTLRTATFSHTRKCTLIE